VFSVVIDKKMLQDVSLALIYRVCFCFGILDVYYIWWRTIKHT